ncbi:MAG: hypothetical protein IPL86_07260 [Flavobacteriales bacterium]|nr:hypothetical protein [Flavobacteriales bacterium]
MAGKCNETIHAMDDPTPDRHYGNSRSQHQPCTEFRSGSATRSDSIDLLHTTLHLDLPTPGPASLPGRPTSVSIHW